MTQQHEINIRVRYCETDAMGFLHHSNYFSYFEMGRTELLRAGGGTYREIEERGLFFVVAKISCAFKSPARYDDELTLRTTLTKAGPVKLEHSYELFRGDQLLATGQSVLACIDREGRVQRIPE